MAPAVTSSSRVDGVPPSPTRTSSAPCNSRLEADADSQDVPSGQERRERQGSEAEPGGRRQIGSAGRRAEPMRDVADDRRRAGHEAVRRPAEPRAAGRKRAVPDDDPHQVGREDGPDDARRQAAGRRDRIGEERCRQQDHGERQDRDPGVPHEDRGDRCGQDREGDGRDRWVHGEAGSSSG